jgi:ketosteroid isomerase-like protein
MRDTGNAVSQDVELVRRLYAELASEGSTQEFEQRVSDDALGRVLDPEIEWVPVTESLLAVDSYRGFDGVRRFWGEFLSAWERYRVETPRCDDAGDQVAVVVHIVGRTHQLDVDEARSSLLTVRDGRVVRVESFADPAGPPGCRRRRSRPCRFARNGALSWVTPRRLMWTTRDTAQ